MRETGFLRGAAVGGVAAAMVTAASTALAGSGVGDVFNLGQPNTVDQSSTLTGNAPSSGAAQLQVNDTLTGGASAIGAQNKSTKPTAAFANAGGGSAASFKTGAAKPPFTVTSSARVVNLNADLLDGIDAAGFYQVGQQVADAAHADTATDASQLGGQPASAYYRSDQVGSINVAVSSTPTLFNFGSVQLSLGCTNGQPTLAVGDRSNLGGAFDLNSTQGHSYVAVATTAPVFTAAPAGGSGSFVWASNNASLPVIAGSLVWRPGSGGNPACTWVGALYTG